MTTLITTAPQFTGNPSHGFYVPEKFAAEVIEALKLAAAVRNRKAVRAIINTEPEAVWRNGQLLIGGTPVAEVGRMVREHSDRRNGGATRHEVALCNGCKKLVPVSEIVGVTKKENRRGYYGTCGKCWQKEAA